LLILVMGRIISSETRRKRLLQEAVRVLKVREYSSAVERCTEDRHVAIHTSRAMLRSSNCRRLCAF